MSLRIKIPDDDYRTIEPSRNTTHYRFTTLGDFFEKSDYRIIRNILAGVFMYNNSFKRESILLTPIEKIDNVLLIIKDEYILADLMIFMAIYHENKLKWESGGKDLD
jgi:hypothetical protein